MIGRQLNKMDDLYCSLLQAQIYGAITDLNSTLQKDRAILYFLGKNFKISCDACGFNASEIVKVVYEMSKLNKIQKKVRCQQLIKELKKRGRYVSTSRGSGRETNREL